MAKKKNDETKPLRLPSALAVIARNEAIQRPVYLWIASFLAMTASADGKAQKFLSSFFLFAKLV
ncbi:MAG: hypothetical protein LBT42_08735 [Tannerella sp.]|nr:hypothetical protein [Tannerella sp.]